jgi:hypothetical protein
MWKAMINERMLGKKQDWIVIDEESEKRYGIVSIDKDGNKTTLYSQILLNYADKMCWALRHQRNIEERLKITGIEHFDIEYVYELQYHIMI